MLLQLSILDPASAKEKYFYSFYLGKHESLSAIVVLKFNSFQRKCFWGLKLMSTIILMNKNEPETAQLSNKSESSLKNSAVIFSIFSLRKYL